MLSKLEPLWQPGGGMGAATIEGGMRAAVAAEARTGLQALSTALSEGSILEINQNFETQGLAGVQRLGDNSRNSSDEHSTRQ